MLCFFFGKGFCVCLCLVCLCNQSVGHRQSLTNSFPVGYNTPTVLSDTFDLSKRGKAASFSGSKVGWVGVGVGVGVCKRKQEVRWIARPTATRSDAMIFDDPR